jgi:acyl-CoA synthetase (AMP-forming)/AMP-acid ligase II
VSRLLSCASRKPRICRSDPDFGTRHLVVRRPGSAPTADELIAVARERLAGYELPRSIDFVEEFPRTPSGKVLKRDLRERFRSVSTATA